MDENLFFSQPATISLFFPLQRWLFQYLYGQNMVNERPPNGFKLNVGSAVSGLVNGKTIPSSLRRNGLPKIIGMYICVEFPQGPVPFCLPLKWLTGPCSCVLVHCTVYHEYKKKLFNYL